MKRLILPLLCLLLNISLFAQKQASLWYFGENAGLDFRNGDPIALTDGTLNTFEGSASIADDAGNLLFYTDGVTVYNRLHQSMPNGQNLWGSYTTTQTLIVPNPTIGSVFYIFTASPQFDYIFGPNSDSVGFHYSIVDMNLESGLGDIVQKNILLFKSTTEKVAAIHHANGVDMWVVAHEWGNNAFRSYLITENGVGAIPVVSSIGEIHTGGGENNSNAIAQLKISPDGTKIASVVFANRAIEVFSFDNATGLLGNRLVKLSNIGNLILRHYGVEFSPNSKLLYFPVSLDFCGFNDPENPSEIWQYSTETGKSVKVGNYVGTLNAMQLSIDGKIYVAQCNDIAGESDYLSVINNPNHEGKECDFQSNGVSLNGRKNRLGLPNFIQSYFLFEDPELDMPNVFSPNSDLYNPVFKPLEFNHMLDARLKVINRWGAEVFSTTEVELGWNGEGAATGVYYWLLQYEGKNGKTGTARGWVHLLR